MISKELLSVVLGFEVTNILHINNNTIAVYDGTVLDDSVTEWNQAINIYEVSHLCKQWAVTRGVTISTFPYYFDDGFGANWSLSKLKPVDFYESCGSWKGNNSGGAESEPQAVFDACEWILKQGIKYAK